MSAGPRLRALERGGSALPRSRARPRSDAAPLGAGARSAAPSPRRWPIVLAGVTAVVAGWAFAPFILVAVDAARSHRVFLGVSGYYPWDGLQYLGWIRDGAHGVIRNLYGTAGDGAVFIHPMFTTSGLVRAVTGVSFSAIMAFWKAVSAAVLVAGCARLVTRHIPAVQWRRRGVAMTLAVFGGLTPFVALLLLILHGHAGQDLAWAASDLVPAMSLWDYAPLAIAIGLMPFAIDGCTALLAGESASVRRTTIVTAALGLVIAWLHPWQGATLIGVFGGMALWRWADGRGSATDNRRLPVRSLLAIISATAAPLAYYLVLSRVDRGWAVAERASVAGAEIPWPVTLACLAPLALIALLTGRRAVHDRSARALVLWPIAAVITVALSRSGQCRALDGLIVPIAVLVARALPAGGASPRRLLAVAVVIAGSAVPLAVFAVGAFAHLERPQVTAYSELSRSDIRAASVAATGAGRRPILTTAGLGTAIPALTGRGSWVGHPIWTRDYVTRELESQLLFEGALSPARARRFVASTGSNALVAPCGSTGRLGSVLAPLGFRRRDVGCARVFLRELMPRPHRSITVQ